MLSNSEPHSMAPLSNGTFGYEAVLTEDIIKVAERFSPYPGGRHRQDGAFSGEQFRDEVLVPSLREHNLVTVVLDGTAGYPSSFLEEAFGGLVREGFDFEFLKKHLRIMAVDPLYSTYRLLAERYLADAGRQRADHHQ